MGALETFASVTTPTAEICFKKLLDNWISKYKPELGLVLSECCRNVRTPSREHKSWGQGHLHPALSVTPTDVIESLFSAMDFFMCSIVFCENVSCCELSGSVLLGKCFVVCVEKGKQFRLQRWCNKKTRKYPSAVDLGDAFNIRCKAISSLRRNFLHDAPVIKW